MDIPKSVKNKLLTSLAFSGFLFSALPGQAQEENEAEIKRCRYLLGALQTKDRQKNGLSKDDKSVQDHKEKKDHYVYSESDSILKLKKGNTSTWMKGNKKRILFFWASGQFGYWKDKTFVGGNEDNAKTFFQSIYSFLRGSKKSTTFELVVDEASYKSNEKFIAPLEEKFPEVFKVTFLEKQMKKLTSQDSLAEVEKVIAANEKLKKENITKEEAAKWMVDLLRNGLQGNPAMASDFYRIWFLADPKFNFNLYLDVDAWRHICAGDALDQFLFNGLDYPDIAGQEGKTFFVHPLPNDGGMSNDQLATYDIKEESLLKLKGALLEHWHQNQTLIKAYTERLKLVTYDEDKQAWDQYLQHVDQLVRDFGDDPSLDAQTILSGPGFIQDISGKYDFVDHQTTRIGGKNLDSDASWSSALINWNGQNILRNIFAKAGIQKTDEKRLIVYLSDFSTLRHTKAKYFLDQLSQEMKKIVERGGGIESLTKAFEARNHPGANKFLKQIKECIKRKNAA